MDSAAFDRLTATLASSGTRRTVFSLVLGGVLAGIGYETAPAKKKKNKKKGKGCPKGKKKCGNKCISNANCCTYVDCTGCRAEDCINGTCQCPPELIFHRGKCGPFINCLGFGESCGSSTLECCGNCVFDVDAGESRCGKSINECLTDNDCKSGPCNGFLCPEANKPYYDLCLGLNSCPNCA